MAAALELDAALDGDAVIAALNDFLKTYFHYDAPAHRGERAAAPSGMLRRLLRRERSNVDRLVVRVGVGRERDWKLRHEAHMPFERHSSADAERDRAYIETMFGRCSWSEHAMRELENKLCVDEDQYCRLWITKAAPTAEAAQSSLLNVHDRAALHDAHEQAARNRAYIQSHGTAYAGSVRTLSAQLDRIFSSFAVPLPENGKAGALRTDVAYRLPVLHDTNVFLRPGDELVSLTGKPYDTMQTVIGYDNPSPGSLKEFGVLYNELPMVDGKVDMAHIKDVITPKTKMVEIQRSRGYSMRNPLTIDDIRAITDEVHRLKPDCVCFVDNCYGEFVDTVEPTQAGADIMAGSLIKNPGGGIAPTGGYIVGRDDLVELASYRLTAPGMGDELGASLSNNRLLFQGFFLAPHVTAQAIKGAIFAAALFDKLGYKTLPLPTAPRGDIIQAIELGSAEKLIAFCGGIQKYSPVDSFAAPEPWESEKTARSMVHPF